MRRTSKTLDSDLEPQIDAAPMRAVTTDFAYTSIVAEPSAGTTTAYEFHSGLGDIVVAAADLVLTDGYSNDLVVGTDGNDILYGGGGNDLLVGGKGDDTLYGGDDHDTLLGQEGNDTLYGENGHDWMLGEAGDDLLVGGAGDDTLEGGLGNDRLEGGIGNDILKGGDGNDVLVGGSGADTMIGGAGRDTFVVSGSSYYYAGLDRITDFETGTSGYYGVRDVIDLRQALQGSTFTGYTAYEAFAQGYIYLVQHGTPGEEGFGTTVYMDRNGSAADYGYDVALVELAGVAANTLHVGYNYGSNFIV